MGVKSSTTFSSERYQPSTSPDVRESEHSAVIEGLTPSPRTHQQSSVPSLPVRNSTQSIPRPSIPPEPPPSPPPPLSSTLFLSEPPDTHPSSSTVDHYPLLLPQRNIVNYPRHRRLSNDEQSSSGNMTGVGRHSHQLPRESSSSRRNNDGLLNLEMLLASLDEIHSSESPRVRSQSHHPHYSRHRDRTSNTRQRHFDDSDPLSFLRSISRTRQCLSCSQRILIENYDDHISNCTRNQVQYNEDILSADYGECSICLEDMASGDRIARLPCLCVYHILCIEDWFKVKSECPHHPGLELPID